MVEEQWALKQAKEDKQSQWQSEEEMKIREKWSESGRNVKY